MPVLMKRLASRGNVPTATGAGADRDEFVLSSSNSAESQKAGSTLLRQCGNTACRSGWMKLWRSRQTPVFEGKWACSLACMQEIVQAAILREAVEADSSISQKAVHQHRVPLGLVLLSRGSITQDQLRKGLEAQKSSGTGRLGEWLVRQKAVDEEQVARALSAQWNCPVLPCTPHDPVAMAFILPRLLIDSFGIAPLRIAGRELLYVAFEDRIDRSVVLAVERMLGIRVEAGVLLDSEFRHVQQEALRAPFPKARLLEAASLRGLVHAFTSMIEERKAALSQIVRIRDYYWLRIWRTLGEIENRRILHGIEDIEDTVCSIAG